MSSGPALATYWEKERANLGWRDSMLRALAALLEHTGSIPSAHTAPHNQLCDLDTQGPQNSPLPSKDTRLADGADKMSIHRNLWKKRIKKQLLKISIHLERISYILHLWSAHRGQKRVLDPPWNCSYSVSAMQVSGNWTWFLYYSQPPQHTHAWDDSESLTYLFFFFSFSLKKKKTSCSFLFRYRQVWEMKCSSNLWAIPLPLPSKCWHCWG